MTDNHSRYEVEEVTYVNGLGGKQTMLSGDFTLLPYLALMEAAKVLEEGAVKYEVDYDKSRSVGLPDKNWERIGLMDHVNHLYQHVARASDMLNHGYQMGEEGKEQVMEELSHALCRALFAVDTLARIIKTETFLSKMYKSPKEKDRQDGAPKVWSMSKEFVEAQNDVEKQQRLQDLKAKAMEAMGGEIRERSFALFNRPTTHTPDDTDPLG